MSSTSYGIGIIGCGTVGQGVLKLLDEQASLYAKRAGKPIEVKRILVRDAGRARDIPVSSDVFTDNADDFFNTPGMHAVVEVAGGIQPVGDYVRRSLSAGLHVITANKSLLAAHGPELFKLARENNASIAFEASCGGGIPIVTALQCGLTANSIESMYGILNGTCNYILTQMATHSKSYETALKEAQEAGFAEADPFLDVSGTDAAQKLVILASLAFGVQFQEDQAPCEGVDTVDLTDIRVAEELGYAVRLLAIAQRVDDGYALHVHPCFVHTTEPLAQVQGSFNALSVFGHAVGHTLYFGRGAGQLPTASAVVADLLNVANGWYGQAFGSMNIWPDQQPVASIRDRSDMETRYYLRIAAHDEPGVIAKVAKILGDESISISAIHQKESDEEFVPVIITTHLAKEGAMANAIEKIASLDEVKGTPVRIRIVDFPEG